MFNSRNFVVPLVVACALFMEQIDGAIIATALPKISASLHTDPVHLNLAITAYMFSLAVFIPLSGWIADRFGARNVFRLAIIVFVAGSIACGLSTDLTELVLARVLQGAGGAMMVPVGRLVLLRTIPKERLVDAMALMTAPALTGPVLGPPIGGIIVTYASWRWIFLINVPIGLLGLYLASKYIPEMRGRKREPLDLQGFVLMALALAGLMFAFETVGRDLFPDAIVGGVFASGLIGSLLYVRHMKKRTPPIVDLRPLRYPTFFASVSGGTLFRIATGAMPFLLPLMLQYGFGLTPAMSGFITLASAAGACIMKTIARFIIRAIGFRRVLIANALINAIFFGGCALFTKSTSMGFIFAFLLIGGLFRSLQFTALTSVAFAEIPEFLMSRANALYSTIQQLGLGLGVAAGALVLNLTMRMHERASLGIEEFLPAFLTLAGLCLVSSVTFIPLARNAGANMSGHRRAEEEAVNKTPA
jgi:EmrB/QacA subfamily drug resistance transporter